jgi:hypothetical protein
MHGRSKDWYANEINNLGEGLRGGRAPLVVAVLRLTAELVRKRPAVAVGILDRLVSELVCESKPSSTIDCHEESIKRARELAKMAAES